MCSKKVLPPIIKPPEGACMTGSGGTEKGREDFSIKILTARNPFSCPNITQSLKKEKEFMEWNRIEENRAVKFKF